MSHDDMSNSSGFNEAAASFSWNGPKKAINPYLSVQIPRIVSLPPSPQP